MTVTVTDAQDWFEMSIKKYIFVFKNGFKIRHFIYKTNSFLGFFLLTLAAGLKELACTSWPKSEFV